MRELDIFEMINTAQNSKKPSLSALDIKPIPSSQPQQEPLQPNFQSIPQPSLEQIKKDVEELRVLLSKKLDKK